MKIFVLMLSLIPSISLGKCAYTWMSSSPPPDGPIDPSQLIVIQTGENSRFNNRIKFEFVSNEHRVKATLVENFKGDMRTTSYLIRPESDLKEGLAYQLDMSAFNEKKNLFEKYDLGTSLSWNVVKSKTSEMTKPKFIETPAFAKKERREFGCGPSRLAFFNFKANGRHMVVSEVISDKGDQQRSLELPMSDQIQIGHGMCSGNYIFEKDRKYQVRFKLKDYFGNESEFTEFIPFEAPL